MNKSQPFTRRVRVPAALVLAGLSLILLVAPSASADAPSSLTMGPQAMEGNLRVAPGTTLLVGFDFTIPGTHPTANITFVDPQVEFTATCVTGDPGGSFVVGIPTSTYADPSNSSNWYPSGDQHSAAVYQGQLAMPDLCGGGQMSLSQGGTFTTTVNSDVLLKGVHVRWHYSANGTSGSWSGTANVSPDASGGGGGGGVVHG